MQTGLLIFVSLLAFGLAVPLDDDVSDTTILPETTPEPTPVPTPMPCQSETETWPAPDLTAFYFCYNGVTYTTQCPPDSYYMNNATVSGCIPSDLMKPSCVNEEVVVGTCTGINLKQPQLSKTITNYWFCEGANQPPVELSCGPGKAFTITGGYLGCFDWPIWRQLRDCTNE